MGKKIYTKRAFIIMGVLASALSFCVGLAAIAAYYLAKKHAISELEFANGVIFVANGVIFGIATAVLSKRPLMTISDKELMFFRGIREPKRFARFEEGLHVDVQKNRFEFSDNKGQCEKLPFFLITSDDRKLIEDSVRAHIASAGE